jgi:hypothetical protein
MVRELSRDPEKLGPAAVHAGRYGASCGGWQVQFPATTQHDLARRDERDIRMGQRRRQRQQSAQSAAGTETGRAAPALSGGPSWRFGTHRINDGFDLPTVEITSTINTDSKARAAFEPNALRSGPVEFRGEMQFHTGHAVLYSGWVTAARPVDESIWIESRNGVQLDEKRLGAFAHAGMTDTELVWSMGRLAGFPDDHLHIGGLRRVPDQFDVVMPVRGVTLEEDLDLGPVTVTADGGQTAGLLGFIKDGEDLKRTFMASGAWAIAQVEADMILEAEWRGTTVIEGVMDRVALEAQYSLAFAPDGTLPLFDRAALFADPTVEPLALVVGSRTRRRWLRTQRDAPYAPPIADRRVRLAAPPGGSDRRFDEALRAWRRAVRAADPIAAVGALWEAIEFYAAGTPMPGLFPKPAKQRLRQTIEALELTEPQRARIPAMLEAANQAPLLLRLREALRRNRVPFSDEEIEVLRRLRDHRNAFVHGKTREDPDSNDLDLAKAIVNRMLAFRSRSTNADGSGDRMR